MCGEQQEIKYFPFYFGIYDAHHVGSAKLTPVGTGDYAVGDPVDSARGRNAYLFRTTHSPTDHGTGPAGNAAASEQHLGRRPPNGTI